MTTEKQKQYWNDMKGKKVSEETKQKISKAMKGKNTYKRSDEIKKGMSDRLKREPICVHWRGKHHTPEAIEKIRQDAILHPRDIRVSGEGHWNWQGGKSFEPYTVDWTNTLKKAVRERDHYLCQICQKEGIQVHHIDYNKRNCDLNNLITLCRSCHSKTNNNRDKWEDYFGRIMNGL